MAQTTRSFGRLSEIAQVAVKHGFGYFFEAHRFSDLLPRRGQAAEHERVQASQRGVHLREMLDELGPTFVKFGQLLSMRPDVVPPDVAAELRSLQDDVRPFPLEEVRQTILAGLGQPIERLFLEFDEEPLAAASIGQVHRAVLPTGAQVAVKVQRPGAPRQIEADLQLLYQAARLAKERVRALDFIDAPGLVDEFARSIRQELDYRLEARNAERFRHDFAGDPNVRVPKVYWSYTRAHVLTLEYLPGTQLGDLDSLGYTPEERRRLVTVVTQAWMAMIFRHGFFHADPHPANVLVHSPEEIGLVDFGQAGLLTEQDLSLATRLFIDVANENVDELPQRLADLGVRYPREAEERFRAEIRELYYRYYGSRLSEIDPIQVMREVFSVIYSLNLELPTRFVLLDKAIGTLAALAVEVDPEFNVFEVAKPYARGLLVRRYTPGRMLTRARREGTSLARIALETPYQVHDILEELRDGEIEVGFVHKGLEETVQRVTTALNRLTIALIVVGGLIGSSLIGIFAQEGPELVGVHFLSALGFLTSAVLGAWLLWGVIRSGRL